LRFEKQRAAKCEEAELLTQWVFVVWNVSRGTFSQECHEQQSKRLEEGRSFAQCADPDCMARQSLILNNPTATLTGR
jgi:hypothetical protein